MNARMPSTLLAAVCVACVSAIALAQGTQAPPAAPAPAATPPAPAPSSGYSDLRRITPVQGNAAAGKDKAAACVACHGLDGVARAPTFSNLGGQSAEYMYWQLVEYKRTALPSSPMTPIATKLTEEDMRDLSVYYAGLPAAPSPIAKTGASTDASVLDRGQSLYLNGDASQGIPPCQGCHGGDANGHPDALRVDANGFTPYAVYPALRGQPYLYMRTQLGHYREGRLGDSTTDFIMNGVAHRMDQDSIDAVAAWLASLEP